MVERQRNPSSTAPWLQGQTILLRVLKSLSLPLRAHQRHDQLIPMDAAKKRVAARNPLFLEADVLIGSARAVVLRENAQPKAPGVGLPNAASMTLLSSSRPLPRPGQQTATRFTRVTRSGAPQSRRMA